jgi:hypothetical protein
MHTRQKPLESNLLMLFRKIVAVYYEIDTKLIKYTLWAKYRLFYC